MDVLPQFPEFKELTFDDKAAYEALIESYPPISDIAFPTLMIWWGGERKSAYTLLNGNLIIHYRAFAKNVESGFTVIGINRLPETIHTLLDYQKKMGLPVGLIHVPEFVVDALGGNHDFRTEEELGYNEYILDAEALATLESHEHSRTRRKIARFHRECTGKIEVKELDFNNKALIESLKKDFKDWAEEYGHKNDQSLEELVALHTTLDYGSMLGMHGLLVYIDGVLHGCALYQAIPEKNIYIVNHIKVQYVIPHIFDFMTQQVAETALKNRIEYINFEMDLDIEGLRNHKMGLRPVSFFKKYRLLPQE